MRLAVDLIWLRPGKVGGTEFYIRNLLDGFTELDEEFELVLVTTKNNTKTFEHYLKDERFSIVVADINNENIGRRIIWQQFHQNRLLRKNGVKYCFSPVYCRPFLNGRIRYINTIHDIQAYHYPEYHPLYEVWYSKLCWWIDILSSWKIIATTEHVKKDLQRQFKIDEDKVEVLNIPATVDVNDVIEFDELRERFNIERENYYYTVAQIIPHKNLSTLIEVFREISENNIALPCKLLISGISGNASKQVVEKIEEYNLQDKVVLTGFVENNVRNSLYKYCEAFLFPSVFEGFGMPPVEAMAFGVPVITTEETSIPEVTQGKAMYVKDPYSIKEWISCMLQPINKSGQFNISLYDKKYIATKYCHFLHDVCMENQ